jgi:hypothetical protein
MSEAPAKPVITTLCLGNEHPSIKQCIQSKADYAQANGYTFFQGGARFYDRTRPMSWSGIQFLLSVCTSLPPDTLIWHSSTDTYITQPSLLLESHLVPLLPPTKDMLLTTDSFGKLCSGSMLLRNTPWLRDFLQRVYNLSQYTHHPQREDGAIASFYTNSPDDAEKMELLTSPTVCNSYLGGLPGEPMWSPGDFVVRFVGVHDISAIPTMIEQCLAGEIPRIPR